MKRNHLCQFCGEEFATSPSAGDRRYCSPQCNGKARRQQRQVRVCKICGQVIQRVVIGARLETNAHYEKRATCSRACGIIAKRQTERRPLEERVPWRTEEQKVQDKERRDREQRASVEVATRYREQWTGAELEIALRSDLTTREAAALLGRSIAGVQGARYRARHDPKWMRVVGWTA